MTGVVDYGGLFHDDVKPGHQFGPQDHRSFRPPGWVEAGCEKLERMRSIAQRHQVTMLQLAGAWNLSQAAVKSVIPTFIQEAGPNSKPIEAKVDELAALPEIKLTDEECAFIAEVGNNQGCMQLNGANRAHPGPPQADRWGLTPDLEAPGPQVGPDPNPHLVCS